MAARLVQRKGLGDAVARPGRTCPAPSCTSSAARRTVGADPEAQRLRELAAAVGVADRLVLRGRVERADMPALLRSADVVLCAPWYEPFGIVPLEAMACGVPVVATAVGGQIDSVVHGVTGAARPAARPRRARRRRRGLLDDPVRRLELGEAGARRAAERFGWERVAAATHEVYAELTGHRHSGRFARPSAKARAPRALATESAAGTAVEGTR